MRKRFVVLVVLLAAVAMTAAAQQPIKVGFWDMGPYVVGQPGGKPPVGAAVDYWTTVVAPAMNVKVQWVGPTPLPRLLKQLESGDVDAVVIVGRNPDREKLFLFPSGPFIHFQPGMAVLKDSPLAAVKTPDDLTGLRVGTAQGAMVSDFIKNAKVTWDNVSTATWIQDSYVKLANKRIDAVYNLGLAALQFEAAQTYAGKFRFIPIPGPMVDIYTAFSRTDRGSAFLKQYDAINSKKAPEMEALVKKYTE
jgi:polar amino acid transport system substrate-binding protein